MTSSYSQIQEVFKRTKLWVSWRCYTE